MKKPAKKPAVRELPQTALAKHPCAKPAKRRAPQNRGAEGRFVKGASGNPGGRPKQVKEVLERFRVHVPELLEGLLKTALEDEDSKTRVAATKEYLDRVIGKPFQALEVSGPDGAPLGPTTAAVVVLPAEQILGGAPVIEAKPLQPVELSKSGDVSKRLEQAGEEHSLPQVEPLKKAEA